MGDLYWILTSMGFIIGCVVLLVVMVRHRERVKAKEMDLALPEPALVPTSVPALVPAKEASALSFMEQREIAMAEARRTGLCMYTCNCPVEHPYPAYRPVRSIFDPLVRWLSATRLNRWRVSLGIDWFWSAREDLVVCTAHQERVSGLLEEFRTAQQKIIAKYLNEQTQALYEYGVSEVHGTVAREMLLLRDPKAREEEEKKARKEKERREKEKAVASGAVADLGSVRAAKVAANGG